MSGAPVLVTERVILRAHRVSDFDSYRELWSNETVVRFIGGRPLDRQESWTRLLRAVGMWSLIGCGFWIVEERETGRLIGEAGVMDAKRTIEPTLDGTLEAGWVFLPDAHGRGLARETMAAVLGWVDTAFAGTALSCIIGEANESSIRLAGVLGFRETARSGLGGEAVIQFRRNVAGA